MSFKAEGSDDVYSDDLALFHTPPTESAVLSTKIVDFHPTSPLRHGSPVEFTISGSGPQYIDMKNTKLHLKLRILKADGSGLDIDNSVGPVNQILHSLWSHIDVYLQQQLVTATTSNYHYKAYMENLLTYSEGSKHSHLQSQGYYGDTPGFFDDMVNNGGLAVRQGLFGSSRTVDLIGRINADIFDQNRLMLNGVEIQLKFWPANAKFCLLSDDDIEYKIDIVDAILKVKKVTLAPSVILGHAAALEKANALYFYERTLVKNFLISRGEYSVRLNDVFQNNIPSRLLIGFVRSDSANGSYRLNPFNFLHKNLSHLGIYVNDESVPGKPIQTSYAAESTNYMEAYDGLIESLDIPLHSQGFGIQRLDYDRGYTLYGFKILEAENKAHLPLIKKGNLKIEATFDRVIDQNITMIVYARFPALLEIDSTRNIVM